MVIYVDVVFYDEILYEGYDWFGVICDVGIYLVFVVEKIVFDLMVFG